MDTQYKVGEPIILNGDIVGYEVVTPDNKVKKLRLSDVVTLINKKQINASLASDENGEQHIAIDGAVEKSSKDHYIVEQRIVKSGKLDSYKCKNVETGELKRIKPSNVWELAAEGLIDNVEAKVVGDAPALFGKDTSLKDLQTVNL